VIDLGKKYKYDFYFKVAKEANFDKGEYLTYTYERDLPLSEEEYNNAAKKLVESVANDINVKKEYITPLTMEEYIALTEKNKE